MEIQTGFEKYPGIQALESISVGEGYFYYPESHGSNLSPVDGKDLGNRIDLDGDHSIQIIEDLSNEDGSCFVYEIRSYHDNCGQGSSSAYIWHESEYFHSPLSLSEINDLCVAKFAEAWQEERNTIRKLNKKINCLKAEVRSSR